jgi:hypothetical protein
MMGGWHRRLYGTATSSALAEPSQRVVAAAENNCLSVSGPVSGP